MKTMKTLATLRQPPRLDPADAFVMAAQTSERSSVEASNATTPSEPPVSVSMMAAPSAVPSARHTSPSTSVQTSKRSTIARKDGRELRRMTVYMPVDVARRLTVSCAETEVDISDVVTQLVSAHLGV